MEEIKYDCKKYGHKWKVDREKETKVIYRKVCEECGYVRHNDRFAEEYEKKQKRA